MCVRVHVCVCVGGGGEGLHVCARVCVSVFASVSIISIKFIMSYLFSGLLPGAIMPLRCR